MCTHSPPCTDVLAGRPYDSETLLPAGWHLSSRVCARLVAVTPPGYKTANGVTVPCEAGSYRSGWAVVGQALTCVSCGAGVRAEKTDRITRYDPASNVPELVPVTTQPDDCCECLFWWAAAFVAVAVASAAC